MAAVEKDLRVKGKIVLKMPHESTFMGSSLIWLVLPLDMRFADS
jgi:hypothetical protein